MRSMKRRRRARSSRSRAGAPAESPSAAGRADVVAMSVSLLEPGAGSPTRPRMSCAPCGIAAWRALSVVMVPRRTAFRTPSGPLDSAPRSVEDRPVVDKDRLSSLSLFGSLSKRECRQMAQYADELELAEGTQLVREGEFAYEFFVIEDGTAEVMRAGEHVADLGPGD